MSEKNKTLELPANGQTNKSTDDSGELQPFEVWATGDNTTEWLVKSAAVKFSWVVGQEITLEAYRDAITATANHTIEGR